MMAAGQNNLCACMGPQGNDPYCPCTMVNMGLEPSFKWEDEDKQRLEAALKTMFAEMNLSISD